MAKRKAKAENNEQTASPPEEWRPAPGFDGLYEVSSYGRVRSIPRQTVCGVLGGGMLAGSVESNGYIRVTLSRDGKGRRISLHRLVLDAFVGACPPGMECRHLDGVRANCNLSNLAWGTRSHNARDRLRHGTHVDNRGERHGMTRLTDAQAREIFFLRQTGVPLSAVARSFGISQSTVSQIANRVTWKHATQGAYA